MRAVVAAFVAGLVLLAGCGENADVGRQAQLTQPAPAQPQDPLEQMVIAFEGNYTRAQIRRRVDEALRLYGENVTDENRSRAGSALVALRRQVGVAEMDILAHMICSHTPDVTISFPDMAGLSAAAIKSGDRCR